MKEFIYIFIGISVLYVLCLYVYYRCHHSKNGMNSIIKALNLIWSFCKTPLPRIGFLWTFDVHLFEIIWKGRKLHLWNDIFSFCTKSTKYISLHSILFVAICLVDTFPLRVCKYVWAKESTLRPRIHSAIWEWWLATSLVTSFELPVFNMCEKEQPFTGYFWQLTIQCQNRLNLYFRRGWYFFQRSSVILQSY